MDRASFFTLLNKYTGIVRLSGRLQDTSLGKIKSSKAKSKRFGWKLGAPNLRSSVAPDNMKFMVDKLPPCEEIIQGFVTLDAKKKKKAECQGSPYSSEKCLNKKERQQLWKIDYACQR